MSKKAVILAGGKGARLRPYTSVFPKPLMPLGDEPILEIIIKQLKYFGFNDITLAVNHQAELIRSYFGAGEKFGVNITYSLESTPLGTMGPLRIISDLPEDFLIMNGDVLSDIDYSNLLDMHRINGNLFTIAAMQREATIDYGVLKVANNTLVGFEEKPSLLYDVSMGIYAVSKDVIGYIPEGIPFGFDQLMGKLLSKNIPVGILPHKSLWLDIGRPDDYMQAIDDFERDRSRYLHE